MVKHTIEYFKERGIEVKDKIPEGFIKTKNATTAPNGYEWYNNGKSLFGNERIQILVKKEVEENER